MSYRDSLRPAKERAQNVLLDTLATAWIPPADAALTGESELQAFLSSLISFAKVRYHDTRCIVKVRRRVIPDSNSACQFASHTRLRACLSDFACGDAQILDATVLCIPFGNVSDLPLLTPTRRRALRTEDLPTLGIPAMRIRKDRSSSFLAATSSSVSSVE